MIATCNPDYQHTVKRSVSCVGRGLNTKLSVRLSIQPAPPDTGYVFVRHDVPIEQAEIPARWFQVTDYRLTTTLTNEFGVKVMSVEHLLAALRACGVDNARIVLNGPELPMMDGSSEPFVRLIRQVGLHQQDLERKALVVKRQVRVECGQRSAMLLPAHRPWLEVTAGFASWRTGVQHLSIPFEPDLICDELARARLFGYHLGATEHYPAVVGENTGSALHGERLRYPDEFVRHEALDVIGDLSLAGAVILGCFVGHNAGHDLHFRLLRLLLRDADNFALTSWRDARNYWNQRSLANLPSGW